jgi:hypothetical protein
MLPTEDLFAYVYVLIHDLILAGAVRDWGNLFPVLPHPSEAHRRTPLAVGRVRAAGTTPHVVASAAGWSEAGGELVELVRYVAGCLQR